jgi:hypothetical protein
MTPDRNLLKNLIAQAKTTDLLVLSVNSLDKNSYKNYKNEIEKFIKKSDDYVLMLIRK